MLSVFASAAVKISNSNFYLNTDYFARGFVQSQYKVIKISIYNLRTFVPSFYILGFAVLFSKSGIFWRLDYIGFWCIYDNQVVNLKVKVMYFKHYFLISLAQILKN